MIDREQNYIQRGQILLNRYRVEEKLGEGGMGQVFLVYDTIRDDFYAMKVIHPHLYKYEEVRRRFLHELKVTEKLTHPGIVRTYNLEFDSNHNLLFFTMEFVRGRTLEEILREAKERGRVPPLPLFESLRIIKELCNILSYTHSKKVIHRDLKPPNVMISESGEVKLMDFGIAKLYSGSGRERHTGFQGTVYYMAPEQLEGREPVTPAADVFSLGALTYQLFTGEIPIGSYDPPSAINPQLTPETDEVIKRSLSPHPETRYPSPSIFWQALYNSLQRVIASSFSQPQDYISNPFSPSNSPNPSNFSYNHDRNYYYTKTQPIAAFLGHPGGFESPGSPQRKVQPSPSFVAAEELQLPLEEQSDSSWELVNSKTIPVEDDFSLTSDWEEEEEPYGSSDDKTPPSFIRKGWGTKIRNDEDKTPPSIQFRQSILFKNTPSSFYVKMKSSAQGDGKPKKHHFSKVKSSDKSRQQFEKEEFISLSSFESQPGLQSVPASPPPLSSPESYISTEYSALSLPQPPKGIETRFLYSREEKPLLEFVKIPAGYFLMGSLESDPNHCAYELPQRKVYLDSYWIARTPITNYVWWIFIRESGYQGKGDDYLSHWNGGEPPEKLLEHPVVNVSIEDLKHFCAFYGVQLPTEAQWEKAARGTEGFLWPWGNTPPTPEYANYYDSYFHSTTPVAAYPKGMSPYGLLDCSGNVCEFCADIWQKDWLKKMGSNPKNPFADPSKYLTPHSMLYAKNQHTIRGGCYLYRAGGIRCAFRYQAGRRAPYIGARVVMNDIP